MRRPCGWRQRSRWIGFVTAQGCTCRNVDSDECATCHNSWTWLDGSPVSLRRFAPSQPSDNRRCAYMSFTGSWYSAECDTQLYSVCKKGTYQYIVFLCTIQELNVLLSQRPLNILPSLAESKNSANRVTAEQEERRAAPIQFRSGSSSKKNTFDVSLLCFS